MKKSCLCIFGILILLLSLTACTGKTKELNLNEFKSRIVVEGAAIEMSGILHFKNRQDMSFTVETPEEISGFTVKLSSGMLRTELDEMSVPIGNLKKSNDIYSPLFEALSLLYSSQVKIPEKGNGTLSFEGSKGNIVTELSYDDEKILNIENEGINYRFIYQ